MKAPSYTFINNINIPTPTSYLLSNNKENFVYDNDDPQQSTTDCTFSDKDTHLSNNSSFIDDDHRSFTTVDSNSTFDNDDPSNSSPRSTYSSIDDDKDNHSYESKEFQ